MLKAGSRRQKAETHSIRADSVMSIESREKKKLFYFASIVFISENNLQTCNVGSNSGINTLETQLP